MEVVNGHPIRIAFMSEAALTKTQERNEIREFKATECIQMSV